MTNKRIADVHQAEMTTITVGSGLLIGDLVHYHPRAKVLAVQEETRTFQDFIDFEDLPFFQAELSPPKPPITIDTTIIHHHSSIRVQNVHIKSASTAGLVQIGSIDYVDGESRLKHIRILESEQ
ncbi:hypothetical protein GCM10010954_13000 [Halobacillus andaensis]|uniref:Spore germination protein GerPE n=1 Tax=Halobacillus andaensis TaxID=1176239 RepID=A0A917B3C5_HALAA|nr:spore germination protein GerPE [Halobacillus andaensis]MBP2004096.1 spore germination protein PE [Halobacillus andaensis]GGF15763.1 hypothetical protein GCM10010954_13000 [Halobacillus andaensis]